MVYKMLRLNFLLVQYIVGEFLGPSLTEVKRESGETPELPRSGKQVRTPNDTEPLVREVRLVGLSL
jgi:hypothetical protein